MKLKVKIYDRSKYDPQSKKTAELIFFEAEDIEVKTIPDAEILQLSDKGALDENKEYCIIHLPDALTATFRNSHVDVFRI